MIHIVKYLILPRPDDRMMVGLVCPRRGSTGAGGGRFETVWRGRGPRRLKGVGETAAPRRFAPAQCPAEGCAMTGECGERRRAGRATAGAGPFPVMSDVRSIIAPPNSGLALLFTTKYHM